MCFKDIIAISVLVGLLGSIFAWKMKMAARKVRCNACGHTVIVDEWTHFKHCPKCKGTEYTKLWKEKKK